MLSLQDTYMVFVPDTTFGFGAVNKIGETVLRLDCKKPLIITDDGIVKAGLLENIEKSLKDAKIAYDIFTHCLPDAPLSVVNECLQYTRKGKYDLVIAVGGGSVIDTTKIVSIAALGDKPLTEYLGTDKVHAAGLHKIYIPTTAGTASEWSQTIVATNDLEAGTIVKISFRSIYFRPDAVFVDPQMTMNLPQKLTAQTGIDALSHGIESFVSTRASIVSDMYSSTSISLVAQNLRPAYGQGSKNIEARYNMSVAATLAFSFAISGVGIIHAMANPMQTLTHISHGEALGIIMPAAMEFNMVGDLPKFARLATLMGENTAGLSVKEQAQKSVEAVRNLITDVGLPMKMRDVGVKKTDIPGLVDVVINKQMHLVAPNPRFISRDEMTAIYEAVW